MNPSECMRALESQLRKLNNTRIRTRVRVTALKNHENGVEISIGEEKIISEKVVLCAGPWSKNLVENCGRQIPLDPIRVDVLYWKIKPEFQSRYRISEKFGAGIYDILEDSDEKFKNLLGGYWCPANEYENFIKIACHGSFGSGLQKFYSQNIK